MTCVLWETRAKRSAARNDFGAVEMCAPHPSRYSSEEGERLVKERYAKFLERWLVPCEQRRVATREGETFVVACGPEDAPPLVLLHGAMSNSAIWMGDAVAWSAHFRVYAVDMIGEAGLSAPSRPTLDSEAYALWLDDVMEGLGLEGVSIVGVSLGGWLALDYATRRAERVERVAVLCPGGVGRQLPEGPSKIVLRAPEGASAPVQRFFDFIALIHENFLPRREELPIFSDEALKLLTMPVLAIVGGKDVMLDSAETKRRLESNVARVEVRYLREAGHVIFGQTGTILTFLRGEQFAAA